MIDLSRFPKSAHKDRDASYTPTSCVMTVNADEHGLDLIAKFRSAVRAHNASVDPKERLYVKAVGRLGKKNPAYAKYRRNYSFVRAEDATRFDVYLLTRDYLFPDRFKYVQSQLTA